MHQRLADGRVDVTSGRGNTGPVVSPEEAGTGATLAKDAKAASGRNAEAGDFEGGARGGVR